MLEECPFRATVVVCVLLTLAFAAGCRASLPQQQPTTTNQRATESKRANSCSLLSETEIAEVVGNPVEKGQVESSTDICKWNTENPLDVDVLIIVREKGGMHEKVLCADLRSNGGEQLSGLGDVATWKFSHEGLFNSGDLEVCGAKGYLSLTVKGKRDEATLKSAARSLTQKILQRW